MQLFLLAYPLLGSFETFDNVGLARGEYVLPFRVFSQAFLTSNDD